MKPFALATLFALFLSTSASAVITFEQLDDDVFSISHRIKGFGSRAKATRLVHIKTASLCVAAGYSYYEVLEQESAAAQQYEAANATMRAQYYTADGDRRVECERNADPEYVAEAREKLAARGYGGPALPEVAAEGEDGTVSASCTVEQIAAMVRAGFTDEQVKAACP